MLERNETQVNLVNVTRTWADEHMHGFDLRVEQLVLVQFSHKVNTSNVHAQVV